VFKSLGVYFSLKARVQFYEDTKEHVKLFQILVYVATENNGLLTE
jgi:hypothetical protein